MRFSSGAPTTPTTTTSIDLIDSAQGKRGSNSGVMQQPPAAPIQIVEEQHLNGGTPHQPEREETQPPTPASDKAQQSIAVAITSPPYSDGSSQTLPDDDGNV